MMTAPTSAVVIPTAGQESLRPQGTNDPTDVAEAVLLALRQPSGCVVRELVICPATESSYP
jgi:NADP-dependent 3-hydroxy acid dehydrogenase YdfG